MKVSILSLILLCQMSLIKNMAQAVSVSYPQRESSLLQRVYEEEDGSNAEELIEEIS